MTLTAPSKAEVRDWECPVTASEVRLVRSVATTDAVRVMATNLTPVAVP